MTQALLEAKDLTLNLQKKTILHALNFTLNQGETVALIGHNGAGKTTLFHVLFGLKFQSSGQLLLNSIPTHETKAREKVSFVPERPYLNPNESALEMLTFFGRLAHIPPADLKPRAHQVLAQVGLLEIGGPDIGKKKLKAFSKGMLQRALIAQALMNDPQFLILDEPMSGLDPAGRDWVRNLIRDLKQHGKTVLFSTHALEDATELADRILVLKQGKIDFLGSPAQFLKQGGVVHA